MPNTNFQTFHQMGQAINEVVRQATGRDNVQNIDMEHITVAQNHYYQDVNVSGPVVSFHAGAAGLPLEKCVVQIDPVQDLRGYDHPWPMGGSAQLLPIYLEDQTLNGVTLKVNSDGSVTFSGTATATSTFRAPAGTWQWDGVEDCWLSGCPVGGNATNGYSLRIDGATGGGWSNYDIGSGVQLNAYSGQITNVDLHFNIVIRSGTVCNNLVFKPMLNKGLSAQPFTPYSNICPIIGWTGANVYVSPTTDAADGQTYTIAFPSEAGTVYGGTLDVITGLLMVDRAMVDLGTLIWAVYGQYEDMDRYVTSGIDATSADNATNAICTIYPYRFRANGFTIGSGVSKLSVLTEKGQYSDIDAFKSAMSGVMLCYPLSTPATYHLTPTEITTLLGVNNIWSDAGDIEVKFKDIKELY